MTTVVNKLSNEDAQQVFSIMIELIGKKGSPAKMITAARIINAAKEAGISYPQTTVRKALDRMIRCKYVRYYKVKDILLYGTTQLSRQRWEEHLNKAKEENPAKPDEEIIIENEKVACQYCGKLYTKRGIKNHERVCKSKN